VTDKTRWEDALGEIAALDRYRVNIPPPLTPDVVMPEVSIESRGRGPTPRFGASIGAGDFSLEGGYYRPDAQAPPELSARLNYRRRF
jgi:hypothetical protein